MAIDWLTVAAQIINFLILVYLLKRFLYQPVIKAMDDREQFIRSQLTQAQLREQQAQETQDNYQSELRSLKERHNTLLSQSMLEAEETAARYLQQARERIEENRQQWRKELKREQQDFLENLKRKGSQMIIHVAQQLLQDLANRELERQMIDVFIQQLEHLDGRQRQKLATDDTPVRVVSTFEADAELRDYLSERLQPFVGGRELLFEHSAELICGIEIRAKGQKVSWTFAEYAHSLQQTLEHALDS